MAGAAGRGRVYTAGILFAVTAIALNAAALFLGFTVGRQEVAELFDTLRVMAPSGEMAPAIQEGETVFLRPVGPGELQAGDVIAYRATNPAAGDALLLRRIASVELVAGDAAYITKGDANPESDLYGVYVEQVIGRTISGAEAGAAARLLSETAAFVNSAPWVCVLFLVLLAGIFILSCAGRLGGREKRRQQKRRRPRTREKRAA